MDVRPWRRFNFACVAVSAAVLALSISVSGQADGGPAQINDMNIRRAEVHEMAAFPDAVTTLAFSPDSLFLACGTDVGRVLLMDPTDGTVLSELHPHSDAVTSVGFSPDGRWLASSGEDGWVLVSDLTDEAGSFSLSHRGAVHDVEFSPRGTYLATVGEERRVRIWETETWEEQDSIDGHTGPIFALAISPEEDLIVTGAGGDDPSIRLWDLATGAELQNDLYEGIVHDIEYSPRIRDRHASIAGTQPMIRLWEVDRGSMLHNIGRFVGGVQDVAYSSAGNALVAVSEDGTLFFTTMPSWTERRRIGFDAALSAVAFSDSRQYIACSDTSGRVYRVSVPQ
jgi:WD40 repeat protein